MQNLTIANGVRAVRTDKYLQRDYSVQDFSEYTCFPTLRLEWCIYLFLGIDPRDFKRNYPGELDAFAKILELAESSRSEGTFPCREGEISDLAAVRLSHTDFIRWAEVHISIRAPEEWQPIGIERKPTAGTVEKGGPCWEEAGEAIQEMRDNPDVGEPKNLEQLYGYMLKFKSRFHNCCLGSEELYELTSVKQRVYRERELETIKNPLKERRFMKQ